MKIQFKGFTTKEVVEITGVVPTTLKYWTEHYIIVPDRHPIGSKSRAIREYSFTQLVEVKYLMSLKKDVSVRTLRQVKDFISNHFDDGEIYDKPFLVVDDGENATVYTQNNLDWCTKISTASVDKVSYQLLISIPNLLSQLEDIKSSIKSGNCPTIDMDILKSKIQGSKHLALIA